MFVPSTVVTVVTILTENLFQRYSSLPLLYVPPPETCKQARPFSIEKLTEVAKCQTSPNLFIDISNRQTYSDTEDWEGTRRFNWLQINMFTQHTNQNV